MHLMLYSRLLIVVISMSLAGCLGLIYNPKNTLQAYEGSKRPDNEKSTLRPGWGSAEIVFFDDWPLRPDHHSWDEFLLLQPSKVEMLPGTHTVTLDRYYVFWYGIRVSSTLSFVSEAGHDYTVRSEKNCPDKWEVAFWIEDDTNGQVVAGHGPCEELQDNNFNQFDSSEY